MAKRNRTGKGMSRKGKGLARRHMARKDKVKSSFKKAYLSRAQAARKLQIDGAEFERLVIMKGIYPREPKRFEGSQGKEKSYYFTKDINWLERDPILQSFRDFKAFEKKVTRLRGRREEFDAQKYIDTHKPSFSMGRVIRERYPTFADALRDLDDALTHVFLYAALPAQVASDSTIEGHRMLTSKMSEQCRELREQWNTYVVGTQSVRRSFISIKGIYYQASVKGETVTWQCPYEFTAKAPGDVVHRTLLYFLEFYIQLVRFVLFKLQMEQKQQGKAEEEADQEAKGEDVEDFPETQDEKSRKERQNRHLDIYKGLVFYISRECNRMHMSIAVKAFGGEVVENPEEKRLTHFIVDRPALPDGLKQRPGVEYVQPQWLFDSINAKARLPVEEYWMGKTPPPHVSPFRISISNDPDEIAALKQNIAEDRRILEDDVPDRVHEIRRLLDPSYSSANPTQDVHLSDDEDDDAELEDDRQEAAHALAKVDDDHLEEDEESDLERMREHIERSKGSKRKLAQKLAEGDNKTKGKGLSGKFREVLGEKRKERETGNDDERKRRKLEAAEAKKEQEMELRAAVAPRKKEKLWRAMQRGIKKRGKAIQDLEEKRTAIRTGAAKAGRMKKGLGGQATLELP